MIKALWGVFLLAVVLLPVVALGQPGFSPTPNAPSGPTPTLQNPLGQTSDLKGFIIKILEVVVEIGLYIVILGIIYTGFLFVKAQGNKEELKTAKSAFLWTIIGAAVLLGAEVLGRAISATIDTLR